MLQVWYSFVMSIGFGFLFNIQRRKIVWAGLSGAIGWMVYLICRRYAVDVIVSTLVGGIAVGLYSEVMARAIKTPATVISIIGIVPLVPGIPSYLTVKYLVERNFSMAASKAIETIGCAGAIAFGIMLSTGMVQMITRLTCKNKKGCSNEKG